MKRGQAAMEFLFTYGWAIFLVLLTVSSLMYFGIVDFDIFVQDSCSFSQNIGDCDEFQVDLSQPDDEKVKIKLTNAIGEQLIIHSCKASINKYCDEHVCKINENTVRTWPAYEKVELTFGCSGLNNKDIIQAYIELNFSIKDSVRTHLMHGSFITKSVKK